MPRYQQRLPEVEAAQWDGTIEGTEAIMGLVEKAYGSRCTVTLSTRFQGTTPSTYMILDRLKENLHPNDWFIVDERGMVSIMHDELFEKTYRKMD